MEHRRLGLVFASQICRTGGRERISAPAAAEAGVWANARGKASCSEDSLRSVWWARLWCSLETKGVGKGKHLMWLSRAARGRSSLAGRQLRKLGRRWQ